MPALSHDLPSQKKSLFDKLEHLYYNYYVVFIAFLAAFFSNLKI